MPSRAVRKAAPRKSPARQQPQRNRQQPPRSSQPRRSSAPVRRLPSSADTERWLIAAIVAAVPVVFWRDALGIFNVTKFTVLLVGAIALLAVFAAELARDRSFVLPRTPLLPVVGIFSAVLVVTTITSTSRLTSLVGQWGRNSGLLMYLALALVLLATVRSHDERSAVGIVKAFLVAGAGVVGYGLVQVAGADPFDWDTYGLGGVFSTLGNSNFASAFVGIVLPLAVWALLSRSLARPWTVLAAVTVLGSGLVLVETQSFQGPLVGGVATASLLLFWVCGDAHLPHVVRSKPVAVRLAGAVVALVLVGSAGAAAVGGVGSNVREGLEERTELWSAGVRMVADRPITGFGVDTFGRHFPAHRSAEHANRVGHGTADAPHNVPLGMFVSGGVLLGVAYLALVITTAVLLARGLRNHRGDRRLLLAALGAAWFAYQLQSLISLDVPPLALAHWVLAGAIAIVSGVQDASATGSGRRARRRLSTSGAVAIAVAGLVLLWPATRPFRADVAAKRGADLVASRRFVDGVSSFERAIDLAPWEAKYWLRMASAYETNGRREDALRTMGRATALDDGNSVYALFAARLAQQLERDDDAARWYVEATRRDPSYWSVHFEAGRFEKERGRANEAERRFVRAAALKPDEVGVWLALAQVRRDAGDTAGALRAYQRVVTLDATNEEAREAVREGRTDD